MIMGPSVYGFSVVLLWWWLVAAADACTHNQYYWISRASLPWPALESGASPMNISMCGNQWYDLMLRNASQVHRNTVATDGAVTITGDETRHWLLCFHQLCAATLNLRVDELPPSRVSAAVLLVRDSMERGCDNIVAWAATVEGDAATRLAMQTLILYNSEATCEVERQRALFSFSASPELFVVDYNATGTVMRDVVYHLTRMTTVVAIYIGIVLFLLLVLGIVWYIVVRNKRREYEFIAGGGGGHSPRATRYVDETHHASDSSDAVMLDELSHDEQRRKQEKARRATESAKDK